MLKVFGAFVVALGFLGGWAALGFMVAFGYLSVLATEKRRREGGPKSTLAADTPNTREAMERA